jgi:hypothetical protein
LVLDLGFPIVVDGQLILDKTKQSCAKVYVIFKLMRDREEGGSDLVEVTPSDCDA